MGRGEEIRMAILPQLKAIFEAQSNAQPMPDDVPIGEMREAMHAMIDETYLALSKPREPVPIEQDISIPVADGEIMLRVYRANSDQSALPCHVYFHGGGFFLGTLDQGNGTCRSLATEAGCVVVSVDYRLAPEHRFPTAAEDAYAALCWVAEHADLLRIDPARISVGGGSAGGNLAAVVSQLARDRSGPGIVGQVLEIPVTDFTSARSLDFLDEGIHIDSAKVYGPIYLRDKTDANDPRASPLLAVTLKDLPPALVMCAEYDQLQPEGEAYAQRLAAEGVPTAYHCWKGQIHGSQSFDAIIPDEAASYLAKIVAFLSDVYRLPSAKDYEDEVRDY
jgi:acetyl esterase